MFHLLTLAQPPAPCTQRGHMQAYDRASARRKAGGNTIIRGLCQRRASRRGGSDRSSRSSGLASCDDDLAFSVFVALHDECTHTALVVAAKW